MTGQNGPWGKCGQTQRQLASRGPPLLLWGVLVAKDSNA
jgi:hypothetical protein